MAAVLVVSGVVAAVGLTYAAFIFAAGAKVVLWVFGPAWIHAVPPLKVLCIYGLLQGFMVIGRSFLTGLGKPERYVLAAATRAVVLAIAIYPIDRIPRAPPEQRQPVLYQSSRPADNCLSAAANGLGRFVKRILPPVVSQVD